MTAEETKTAIKTGRTALGIELGSTRIKAVLVDLKHRVIASGSFSWENQLVDGFWTYDLDAVHIGLQHSFQSLRKDVESRYGLTLETTGVIGISGMMHGYLVFDENDKLLVPFRTWRNTNTEKAARELTELMQFNIPLRWSISHLYQAVIDAEPHVKDIRYITTLAGYVHWKLTGEKVLGVGEASGMFPVCSDTKKFDEEMLKKYEEQVRPCNFPWNICEILPKVLSAGEPAGKLTDEGVQLLDPSNKFTAGVPMAPPEGDAGTGMVATNAVAMRTGNVSAGTSIFAMLVLEKPLSRMYTEIDMVATPSGRPVAMVHCNNGTSDLDAWMKVFKELTEELGKPVATEELYTKLYQKSLNGVSDGGGIITYNYLSGEPITGLNAGLPMVIRQPGSIFTLSNFMRAQIYSMLASLRIGMETLYNEGLSLDRLMGHGGFFKTPLVGQKLMADALGVPVSVMETAGEGGPYGMAVLAAYRLQKREDETLDDYLADRVFSALKGMTIEPDATGEQGFNDYLERYLIGLKAEEAAVYGFIDRH